MKFYISTTGIKRLTISSAGAGKGTPRSPATVATRRISSRMVMPLLLVLALVLPFLFVRIAVIVLDSATACSSTLDCVGWRIFSGGDESTLREELARALLEAKDGNLNNNEQGIESFNQLVQEMTLKQQDVKAFAFKTKAMLSRMEHKVQSARQRESVYWHLASHGVPKSIHCLCLKLAEEYAVNAIARSRLPPPEYVSRLSDPSFHHLVLLTDNVLAASVVISSTVQKSAKPEKLIFHIVTDKRDRSRGVMGVLYKHQIRRLTKMKKWSGGLLIVLLAMILVFRYSSIVKIEPPTQAPKQSAAEFFGNHPTTNDSVVVDSEKKGEKPYKKHHFVEVDGLDDLFASHDIFKEGSRALLVWPHMRTLLSRSDALPETAKGVKEASVAWKDLLSAIDKDRASKLNKSDNDEVKNCPFSVSTFDKIESRYENILDIPCGLIDDSSISLVGIPNGHSRSFQIQLLGSQLLGESEPPIILHYNVSLPGDNMTQEPFVVQNTWTHELGWGKEERCPSHWSPSNLKVDGLVLCNEQAVRSSLEENLNVSQPSRDMLTNVSGGAYEGSNFPFVEGNPFTATFWVGLEGFHLTVNGRHETSFAYREKLEPWSVSKVRVAGGLDLLSALAKGLPVSEDHDLAVDVEHLRAPPTSKKRLLMLVGVFSTGNNFERRMALRRAWMQYKAVRSGDVAVRFFIGLHKNSQVNIELWREAEAYGDIQLMPFVDYYSLISLKTIAISIFGTKIHPAKYIMKTDDDAFVRIDEVISSLKGKPTKGLLYGRISFESSPDRDKGSKWFIDNREWPYAMYPPWAHGPGYIISRDIAKFIVRSHQEGDLKLFKLEDVAMGIWIQQFKYRGQEVNYVTDDRFYNAGCEANYILAHYQSPRLVLCLWEKLQKEHEAVCCE